MLDRLFKWLCLPLLCTAATATPPPVKAEWYFSTSYSPSPGQTGELQFRAKTYEKLCIDIKWTHYFAEDGECRFHTYSGTPPGEGLCYLVQSGCGGTGKVLAPLTPICPDADPPYNYTLVPPSKQDEPRAYNCIVNLPVPTTLVDPQDPLEDPRLDPPICSRN